MTVFLHGFWGQPADWRQVFEKLPITEMAYAPDLYESGGLDASHTLTEWVENFHNRLDKECGPAPVKLVGYSMGARLALNAVIACRERFSNVLLLSGNPLLAAEEHAARLQWEKDWSKKFLTLPWSEIEAQWQEQSVFSGSAPLARRETASLREALGMSLENWSPRLHTFSWAQIKALPSTVEWAYGALDQKYMEVAKTLREQSVQGQISIIPNAGHRLTTDASDFIARWISGEKI